MQFYRGMSHAAWHMLRHEGPAAFAKGLVPTMLQTAPYTSIQFGAFEVVTRLAGSWQFRECYSQCSIAFDAVSHLARHINAAVLQ